MSNDIQSILDYIPKFAQNCADIKQSSQRRLLLVGQMKSGKSYSSVTTAPKPFVVDFDNSLQNEDIKRLNPPCFPAFTLAGASAKVNALEAFMRDDLPRFASEQTVIFDSLSTIADAVRTYLDAKTPLGKDKNPDGFWFWKNWAIWFCQFATRLTEVKCNIILIAHEQEVRDSETGRILAIKWLLQGQEFSPRLGAFFTDIFRQTRTTKPDPNKPGHVVETFEWQVKSDDKFMCNTRMNTTQKFVPASWKSFELFK